MPHLISKAGHILTLPFKHGSNSQHQNSQAVEPATCCQVESVAIPGDEQTDLHHGSNLSWFSLTEERPTLDAVGVIGLLSLEGDERRPTPRACSPHDVM